MEAHSSSDRYYQGTPITMVETIHAGKEKHTQGFRLKTRKRTEHLDNLRVDGKTTLK
jgi:hypothetical protein